MKIILVPCDFSQLAIDAYRYALDIASQSKGVVHLLHVAEYPVGREPILTSIAEMEENLIQDIHAKIAIEFDKITSLYFNENVTVISEMEFGIPSKKILNYILDHSIDLVVMGSHGTRGLHELLIGSNAEKIVRTASVPVLVLKNYFQTPIKNIVFPNTFDIEFQEDLVVQIMALQDFFNAQIHLLWINTPFNLISESVIHTKLKDFASHYSIKNYTTNVISSRNEEGGILNFAKSVGSDLIAMGTHGRKGIKHLLLGSVAEDVMNHSDILIWTYALQNELTNEN